MSEIISVKAEDIRRLMAEAEVSVETRFDKVTVVCVKLANGFVITEASGAVDPRNYSQEIGKQVCLERIEKKLWELEGYALQKQNPENDKNIRGCCKPDYEALCRQLQHEMACIEKEKEQYRQRCYDYSEEIDHLRRMLEIRDHEMVVVDKIFSGMKN